MRLKTRLLVFAPLVTTMLMLPRIGSVHESTPTFSCSNEGRAVIGGVQMTARSVVAKYCRGNLVDAELALVKRYGYGLIYVPQFAFIDVESLSG